MACQFIDERNWQAATETMVLKILVMMGLATLSTGGNYVLPRRGWTSQRSHISTHFPCLLTLTQSLYTTDISIFLSPILHEPVKVI
jgi:hypothetical protein